MEKDLSIYENTKRNEKCPCGSEIIFKKCCMKEYREAKKELSTAIVSSYTPLKPLNKSQKDAFTRQQKNRLINIPLVLNFALFCDVDRFKEMEDIILKNIPLNPTSSFPKK